MAKRRRRRTSIRTAAATVQDRFIERVKELRANPLKVLPACPEGEPKSIRRIRIRLERMAAKGKGNFLDRRDKGIVGAVAQSLPLANLSAVPRLIDQKVAGRRRFYLQRGHVSRQCSLGIQNHDDALVLLSAYRPLAKSDSLHFFAGPKLWCSGTEPSPPLEWVQAWIGEQMEASTVVGGFACPHDESERIIFGFRGGADVAVCTNCASHPTNLHQRLAGRYAGPRLRQPVDVGRLHADGTRAELDPEVIAAYRAGLKDEKQLLRSG